MSERSESGIHPLLTVLAAIVIAVGVIGSYVWATYTGPVHAGQVVSVSAYPIHRELSTGSGLGGLNGGANIYDEVIVIADVKIKSTTKLPLFLHEMWGEVTLPNGDVIQSLAASGEDYRKVFVAYPALEAAEADADAARHHDDPGPGGRGADDLSLPDHAEGLGWTEAV